MEQFAGGTASQRIVGTRRQRYLSKQQSWKWQTSAVNGHALDGGPAKPDYGRRRQRQWIVRVRGRSVKMEIR